VRRLGIFKSNFLRSKLPKKLILLNEDKKRQKVVEMGLMFRRRTFL